MSEISPLLELKQVSKSFNGGRAVLAGITLNIYPGEILCILGKSGSGKSTLLNILAGIEAASGGTLSGDCAMSYVPQKDCLMPWRSVLENIILPFELRRSVDSRTVEIALELLESVELAEAGFLYPETLSGGMRQRVSLVRALLQDTPLMLFDEPFSAIDFNLRLKLGRCLREFCKRKNRTSVFVTHHIEEAMSLGDRVLTLSGEPARVSFETMMRIPEEYRDPVAIRKWERFGGTFEDLWQSLEG